MMFNRLAAARRSISASDRYLLQLKFLTGDKGHIEEEVEDFEEENFGGGQDCKDTPEIGGIMGNEKQSKEIGDDKQTWGIGNQNESSSSDFNDKKKSYRDTRPPGPWNPELIPFHKSLENVTPRQALSILKDIREQGLEPTVITYNLVLKNLARENWTAECDQIFREMEDAGIKPTVVTYTTIMTAFTRLKNYNSAFGIMEQMKEKGVPMNQVSYGTALLTCAKGNFLTKAEEIFSEMISAQIQPSALAYGSMLRIYGDHQQWDRMDETFENMKRSGIEPRENIYAVLLHSYSKANMLDKMMEIKRSMEASRITVDNYCYNALIHGLVNASRYKEAMEMIYEAQSRRCADEVIYSHMMYLYSLNNDVKNCRGLLDMLLSARIPVTNRSCTAYLRAHAATGNGEECALFLENMEKNLRLKPTASHFNMIVDELDKNGFEALAGEFFKEGKRRTGFPRIYEQINQTEPKIKLVRASYSMAKFALNDQLGDPSLKGSLTL